MVDSDSPELSGLGGGSLKTSPGGCKRSFGSQFSLRVMARKSFPIQVSQDTGGSDVAFGQYLGPS